MAGFQPEDATIQQLAKYLRDSLAPMDKNAQREAERVSESHAHLQKYKKSVEEAEADAARCQSRCS